MLKVISTLLVVISLGNAHLVRFSAENVVKDINQELIFEDSEAHEKMTPSEAKNYCDSLDVAGHDNWRLPTFTELFKLSENDVSLFKNMNGGNWFISTDNMTHTVEHKPIWLVEPFSRRVAFVDSDTEGYKFSFKCVAEIQECVKAVNISEK
jgi:hypothetical protein